MVGTWSTISHREARPTAWMIPGKNLSLIGKYFSWTEKNSHHYWKVQAIYLWWAVDFFNNQQHHPSFITSFFFLTFSFSIILQYFAFISHLPVLRFLHSSIHLFIFLSILSSTFFLFGLVFVYL